MKLLWCPLKFSYYVFLRQYQPQQWNLLVICLPLPNQITVEFYIVRTCSRNLPQEICNTAVNFSYNLQLGLCSLDHRFEYHFGFSLATL